MVLSERAPEDPNPTDVHVHHFILRGLGRVKVPIPHDRKHLSEAGALRIPREHPGLLVRGAPVEGTVGLIVLILTDVVFLGRLIHRNSHKSSSPQSLGYLHLRGVFPHFLHSGKTRFVGLGDSLSWGNASPDLFVGFEEVFGERNMNLAIFTLAGEYKPITR